LYKGAPKKSKKGKVVHNKSFTLNHCWSKLEHDDNWKNRDVLEVPKKINKTSKGYAKIIDDDHASSEDGKISPTPNSVARTKIPTGKRQVKEKRKKTEYDDTQNTLEAIVHVRKNMAKVRKIAVNKEIEENRLAEERMVAAEERRLATRQWLEATKVRKVAMEETLCLMEHEK
jgi:hypothetical protein